MKKAYFKILVISIFCCLLSISALQLGCTNNANTENGNEVVAYVRVSDANSSNKRIIYLQPKTCSNEAFTAEIYGSVFDGEVVLNIKQMDYTFEQIAGRVWFAKVSVAEVYGGEVIIYVRRQILGKTLDIEHKTDIYGNELICEIGEGYGEVDWLQCFSYTYLAD